MAEKTAGVDGRMGVAVSGPMIDVATDPRWCGDVCGISIQGPLHNDSDHQPVASDRVRAEAYYCMSNALLGDTTPIV